MEYILQMNDEVYDFVKSIILDADLEDLKRLNDYSYKIGKRYLKDKERVFQFMLCIDEIFSNCILHAYNQKGGEVDINFLVKDNYFITEIRDFGTGINIKNKDRYLSLNENLLVFSGRGLFLVNNLCDKLVIRRCGSCGTFIKFYFKMGGIV